MTEKRIALIIASDRYEDTDLRQLVAPAQDAAALAGVLEDPAIGGFDVKTLLNKSSHEVRQQIEAFFTGLSRDDLLLLYFSCHGIKDESGHLYFATTDTRRKLLRSTAISSYFVNEVMRLSPSRRQVLLLDCCFSGAFARGMVAKSDQEVGTKESFEGRGRVVLTASDAIQYAFEGEDVTGEGVRSIFTRTLVHGLTTGEADVDLDGYISFEDLSNYVCKSISEQRPEQEPRKWALDVHGDIIIARNPNPVVKPLPPELQPALESPLAYIREGAARELSRLLQSTDKGLALAAREALEVLKDDDSRSVSSTAGEILKAYEEERRKEQEELERKAEEEKRCKEQEELKRKAEEEKRRKEQEELEGKAEEERKRKEQEKLERKAEEERRRKEEEELKRKAVEEKQRKEQEELERKAAEEEKRRRDQEELERKARIPKTESPELEPSEPEPDKSKAPQESTTESQPDKRESPAVEPKIIDPRPVDRKHYRLILIAIYVISILIGAQGIVRLVTVIRMDWNLVLGFAIPLVIWGVVGLLFARRSVKHAIIFAAACVILGLIIFMTAPG